MQQWTSSETEKTICYIAFTLKKLINFWEKASEHFVIP